MKRIISLILALTLCLFACAKQEKADTDSSDSLVNNGIESNPDGGDILQPDKDSDIAKLFDAVANTLSQDNVTLTVDLSDDSEASIPTIDIKADLKNASFLFSYAETWRGSTEHYTCGYDDQVYYECLRRENGLPRGRVNKVDENAGTALVLLTSIFEDHSQLSAKNIVDIFSGVFLASGAENPVSEHIALYITKCLADDEWLSDLAGLSVTSDGAVETYTIAPNVYGIANDLLTYLDGKIDSEMLSEAKEDLEREKAGYESVRISIIIEVTNGLISKAQLEQNLSGTASESGTASRAASTSQSGMLMNKVTLTFTDYGSTETPIDELKQTIDDAHNGHDKCVKCGDDAYFSCYCESCAFEIFCYNYCGNLHTEDSQYCSDCYTPCADCGEEHGRNGGYCYDCYQKHYCSDCDNPAVHFQNGRSYGYCDDCYSPCPDCGNQGNEYCNGYCYECFGQKFCSECRTNSITHQFEYDGYCDECFIPCPGCGEQGEDYYNGYCYDCFSDKYCMMCDEKDITHPEEYGGGYCDDCFKACTVCGKYASSSVEGYCYACARTIFCIDCYENKITVTASDGYGYCADCYSKCPECGEELRELINGVCYECYYNKYCHECGNNEITHGSGTEHKLCDECYQ